MAARVIVLALAVGMAALAVLQMHDSRRCQADLDTSFGLATSAKRPVPPGLADSFIADCRGSHLLAVAASVLVRRHAIPQALKLSNEAIRRESDNYEGWLALSQTLRGRGLDTAARRAFAHVIELNPRYGRPLD